MDLIRNLEHTQYKENARFVHYHVIVKIMTNSKLSLSGNVFRLIMKIGSTFDDLVHN